MRWNNIYKGVLMSMQAVFLWACSSDIVLDQDLLSNVPIRIEAGYDNEETTTRSIDRQNQAFEANQQLNVYIKTHESPAKTVGQSPIVCTTSAPVENVNALTPDYQTYYPSSTNVDIFAWYPTTITESSTSFTVPTEQGDGTYMANDLMYAIHSNQPKTDQTIRLQFNHLMTKIMVTVTLEEELTLTSLKLMNFNNTVAVTPATGVLGALSNAQDITIENGGTALVPPQTINGRFLAVETNLGTAYFETNKTFEAGKEYSVTLIVGRVNLGLTGNIVDWTQDGARQTVQQSTADGYTIDYVQSTPFIESYRTAPFEQPALKITQTATGTELKRYTSEGADYDYSVLFFGNNQAGTATMVISGNQDKTAYRALSWVKTFTITQGTGSLTYPAYSAATSYDASYVNGGSKLQVPYVNGGTVNWPCTQVCDPGTATFVSTNTSVATVDRTGTVTMHGVGEATIMVSSPSNGNYTAASGSYNLEVTKRTSSGLTIVLKQDGAEVTNNTYTYTGMPCKPSVSVYDGAVNDANLLRVGSDYTVGFSNNTNAGTATVTITGAGDYNGTATKNFTINPITTTFNESYENVTMSKNATLSRPATINHLFGTVTYSSSNNNVAAISSTGVITTGNTTGTATITVSVAEPSPKNYTAATMTYTVSVVSYDQSFSYTGKTQTYTCQKTGTYLLEVWGAGGATSYSSFAGGRGAYIAGTITLTEGQVLYVNVGGQGTVSGGGGWNGGGTANSISNGGGGATDISICGTANSTTWNETAHLNSRIIVAGGGGGALYYNSGNFFTSGYGAGGGGGAYSGRNGSGSAAGRGGSISGAGSSGSGNTSAAGFGYGGNYTGSSYAGAGGGGWYGGGAGGDNSRHGSGGGGSSYIWNSKNKSYYSGHGTNNAPTTTGSVVTDVTQFYITESSKTAATNTGNGKAKITFIE